MKIETQCLHAGYKAGNGEPQAMPIYQSTTYRYDSTDYVGHLFDRPTDGYIYSRFANPTVSFVEQKIAALEGGVGAMCTSSGQAASLIAMLNILENGDHFICTNPVYGGTVNLFAVTMKKMGYQVSFISPDADDKEIESHFQDNTKAVFSETISNPAISVLDIERWARIAHAHNIPFIIDNTLATPVLCQPKQHGADIIIHSTTKYMDGHALQVGGVIVDCGTFDWRASGKFPGFTQPDESYHGMVYGDEFHESAFVIKARMQLMRDIGAFPSAHSAFLLNLGLETLALRMERYSQNAEKVAAYFAGRDELEFVNYPTLNSNRYHELAKKYLPKGCSGVVSLSFKEGRRAAADFIDRLKLASLVVHVADIRTCVLHPATSTHRQLTDEQIIQSGITPGMVRFSCGLEHIDDILEDIEQALR